MRLISSVQNAATLHLLETYFEPTEIFLQTLSALSSVFQGRLYACVLVFKTREFCAILMCYLHMLPVCLMRFSFYAVCGVRYNI